LSSHILIGSTRRGSIRGTLKNLKYNKKRIIDMRSAIIVYSTNLTTT
jgi:hypothetical protein